MVEIRKAEELAEWLADKPANWAAQIAARAALRVFPLFFFQLTGHVRVFEREDAFEIRSAFLTQFHTTVISVVAAKIQTTELATAALSAYSLAVSPEFKSAHTAAYAALASAKVSTYKALSPSKYRHRDEFDAFVSAQEAAVNAIVVASLQFHEANFKDFAIFGLRVDDFWGAVSEDCISLETNLLEGWTLFDNPLWQKRISIKLISIFEIQLSDFFETAEWKIVSKWYQDRLDGDDVASSRNRPSLFRMELEIGKIPFDQWLEEPVHIFETIGKIQEKYWNNSASEKATEVPSPRPATIEPVWVNGFLTLPKTSVGTDLSLNSMDAALHALKDELRDLISEARLVSNIDQRPVDYLDRLEARIPLTAPPQVELFKIAHAQEKLRTYGKTVSAEWPDYLSASYLATLLAFDRTLKQFPVWRQFLKNTQAIEITAEEIAAAPVFAGEFANALRDPDMAEIVDPVIPEALDQLSAAATKLDWQSNIDAGSRELETLAIDLLESIANTVKHLAARLVFQFKRPGHAFAKWAEELELVPKAKASIGKTLQGEADNAGPTIKSILKKAALYGGPIVGGYSYGLFSWLGELLMKWVS